MPLRPQRGLVFSVTYCTNF